MPPQADFPRPRAKHPFFGEGFTLRVPLELASLLLGGRRLPPQRVRSTCDFATNVDPGRRSDRYTFMDLTLIPNPILLRGMVRGLSHALFAVADRPYALGAEWIS